MLDMSFSSTPVVRDFCPENEACIVAFEGPGGVVENLRISHSTPLQAVDGLLRSVFGIQRGAPYVVRDRSGCAVPLDARVLLEESKSFADKKDSARSRRGSDAQEPLAPFILDFSNGGARKAPRTTSNQFRAPMPLGKTNDELTAKAAHEECAFWCELVGSFSPDGQRSQCKDADTSRPTLPGLPGFAISNEEPLPPVTSQNMQAWQLTDFDTSPHRIESVYDLCAEDKRGDLTLEQLQRGLREVFYHMARKASHENRHMVEDDIQISQSKLLAAVLRIQKYLKSRDLDKEKSTEEDEVLVTRKVLDSLWQRLMLGAVCQKAYTSTLAELKAKDLYLLGYNERSLDSAWMSEQDFYFGGNLRFKPSGASTTCWARIDRAGPDRLNRMGVKFFLHPVAIEEAIAAAREGMTKIDLYRHQYFVALETYALETSAIDFAEDSRAQSRKSEVEVFTSSTPLGEEPPPVGPQVVRSAMFLVATGNPERGYRDWLLSLVNEQQIGRALDPLDRFRSSPTAAYKVLDSIKADLKAHSRMREYQADFLLFSVLDRAVAALMPILRAYARRLRWLNEKLSQDKLKTPSAYISEVSTVRLELQELLHWLAMMRGIIKHLEVDCKGVEDGGHHGAISWNFGAWAKGQGKYLLLFLRGTDEALDRAADRIAVLDQLCQNYQKDHTRYQDSSLNKTLSVLTTATTVFMPAQFVAAVYGMNFKNIPETEMKHGYLYFWILALFLIVAGATAACMFLRRDIDIDLISLIRFRRQPEPLNKAPQVLHRVGTDKASLGTASP